MSLLRRLRRLTTHREHRRHGSDQSSNVSWPIFESKAIVVTETQPSLTATVDIQTQPNCTAECTSAFWRLPYELRELIYEDLLVFSLPILLSWNKAPARFPDHDSLHALHVPQPAVLLVSRRMRQEAAEVFYSRNAFKLGNAGKEDHVNVEDHRTLQVDTSLPYRGVIPPDHLQFIRHMHFNLDIIHTTSIKVSGRHFHKELLFNLNNVLRHCANLAAIHFWLPHPFNYAKPGPHGCSMYHDRISVLNWGLDLIHEMLARAGLAEALKVTVIYEDIPRFRSPVEIPRSGLARLEQYGWDWQVVRGGARGGLERCGCCCSYAEGDYWLYNFKEEDLKRGDEEYLLAHPQRWIIVNE